jgi:hypothetical protein
MHLPFDLKDALVWQSKHTFSMRASIGQMYRLSEFRHHIMGVMLMQHYSCGDKTSATSRHIKSV